MNVNEGLKFCKTDRNINSSSPLHFDESKDEFSIRGGISNIGHTCFLAAATQTRGPIIGSDNMLVQRRTDRQTDRQTDRRTDGLTNDKTRLYKNLASPQKI